MATELPADYLKHGCELCGHKDEPTPPRPDPDAVRAAERLLRDRHTDAVDRSLIGVTSGFIADAKSVAKAYLALQPPPGDAVMVPLSILRELIDNCEASTAESDISDDRKNYRRGLLVRSRALLTATPTGEKGQG